MNTPPLLPAVLSYRFDLIITRAAFFSVANFGASLTPTAPTISHRALTSRHLLHAAVNAGRRHISLTALSLSFSPTSSF
jgi:hypothetical protein